MWVIGWLQIKSNSIGMCHPDTGNMQRNLKIQTFHNQPEYLRLNALHIMGSPKNVMTTIEADSPPII